MGKKSKRNKALVAKGKENIPEGVSQEVVTLTTVLECPKDGWIAELKTAKKKAKKSEAHSEAHLRVAVAACQVRQWETCEAACKFGLSLNPGNEETKVSLLHYQKRATEEIALTSDSRIHEQQWKELFEKARSGGLEIDREYHPHPYFDNLNTLQYVGMEGDIGALETIVALGAAIDLSVIDRALLCSQGFLKNDNGDDIFTAPKGTSLLCLLCASLAWYHKMQTSGRYLVTPDIKRLLKGQLECAILLVQLGADSSRTFGNLTNQPPPKPFHEFDLYGKTARELADIAGKHDLIQAMKEYATKEDKIANAYCRCGSRLPWLQCHAGIRKGQSAIYQEGSDGKSIFFRLSPLAPCMCNMTGKIQWRCCWEQTSRPAYLNDTDATLRGRMLLAVDYPMTIAMYAYLVQLQDPSVDEYASQFPGIRGKTYDEQRAEVADSIRKDGLLPYSQHANSQIRTWDPEVYAGCVELIGGLFGWNDTHWMTDKSELMLRVQEWNDALDEYCDNAGLIGSERQVVIEKHTANPCAPCANPGCDAFECKIKEFQRCSLCKSVAYCSRECQRHAWKEHKLRCIAR